MNLRTQLGPVSLASPLVAASGTVGSLVELAGVVDFSLYGAAVAKSVSGEPWPGRPAPRFSPVGVGLLNGIGIQNPGIEEWVAEVAPRLGSLGAPAWGSAVGKTAAEFAVVASRLQSAGVAAVEVNLSCPNLEDGRMFALDPVRAGEVVCAVREAVTVPVGAKLTPNSEDVVSIATSCADAGADWVVLGNTVWGAGIDVETRRPLISGVVWGYSGIPVKPIALRSVIEVHGALPELPILGCGGVSTGADVVEYLLAGASAVAMGTIHFAEPRAARRILAELRAFMERTGVDDIGDLVGRMEAS